LISEVSDLKEMHDHCHTNHKSVKTGLPRILLVGNPNVGKSAIFNLLTGRYVTVSNYPGTTVEITGGEAVIEGRKYEIIDTPGINSLTPMSEDERVTRDIMLEERPDVVIQVIDSKNLRRAMFVTLQLIEMGLPLIIDLNMKDEADRRGIEIDEFTLKNLLGVEVISTVAVRRKGINSLKRAVSNARVPIYSFKYDEMIETSISKIETLLPDTCISRRAVAVMILAGDETLKEWLIKRVSDHDIAEIERIRDELATKYGQPLSYVINQQRLMEVDQIISKIFRKNDVVRGSILNYIEDLTIHPIWGIPFLVIMLIFIYEFVGVFGAGILVDFFEEIIFGEYLNPWITRIVMAVVPLDLLQDLLIGQYGIMTMALTYAIAIILPITTTFFIVFSIMEDSGYLPRLSAMLNKLFRIMGLNGKAVLPMVLGLGCDTMATLTTRILDTPKERLMVTLLLALGIPCSAQLGVILGMLGRQPVSAAIVWALTLIMVMIIVGYLSSKILPGQSADFILELPPLRMPQFSNVMVKTLWRIEWYLKEAVPLFILGTFILFIAHKTGLLPTIQKIASPVIVHILGLPAVTAESFIMGFLRRDYGAAGLFALQQRGMLNTEQVVISLVTITLFVPCIANFFMIIKERGFKTAICISLFIFPFAILVGGLLHRLLLFTGIFN